MARAMKDSGVEWLGEIPEHWEISKNKFLFTEINEQSETGSEELLSVSEHYGIKPRRIAKANDEILTRAETLVGYKKCEPDDIVMNIMLAWKRSIGMSYWKGIVSPAYAIFRLKKLSNSSKYFTYLFRTDLYSNYFKSFSTGIMDSRLRLYPYKFAQLYSHLPPTEEQRKIVMFLDDKTAHIDSIIARTKESVEEFKAYKQAVVTQTVTKGLDLNVKLKDSEIEWIGEIPENWSLNKLKRIFEIKKNIANSFEYDILSVTQKGLKVKDITSNEGQISADYSKYQIVEPNDFVMNHMDLLTGWVDCSDVWGVTSPDYRVFKAKHTLVVNNRYYNQLFQMCYSNKIFYGLGQGVSHLGRWRLQTDKFVNFVLPIPPIEEQQQIADYLDEKCAHIDSLIADKETLIREFEDYKRALIFEYVTGKKEVE